MPGPAFDLDRVAREEALNSMLRREPLELCGRWSG